MATIVQPYNPWREQLAANILGPLVGGMIQRGQEAEQNRKMNALRGELNRRMTETPESMIADVSNDPAQVMPQTPATPPAPVVPQGTASADYANAQGDVFDRTMFEETLANLDSFPELKAAGVKDAATLKAYLEVNGYKAKAR